MYASVITDQIDEDLETALRIARLYGYTWSCIMCLEKVLKNAA